MDTNYKDITDQLKNIWSEKIKDLPSTWFKISLNYLILSCNFLLSITDILVNHFKSFDLPGIEKKAKVILITSDVFDFVASTVVPLAYKPFTPVIKTVFINCILSVIIDFIVNKYKKGSWSNNEETKKELFV